MEKAIVIYGFPKVHPANVSIGEEHFQMAFLWYKKQKQKLCQIFQKSSQSELSYQQLQQPIRISVHIKNWKSFQYLQKEILNMKNRPCSCQIVRLFNERLFKYNDLSINWMHQNKEVYITSKYWYFQCDSLCNNLEDVNKVRVFMISIVYRPNGTDLSIDLTWARRATRLCNAMKGLITANAYISTLGGGYFLCKHIDQAQLMAKLQIAVANGLGDPVLASKCRINLAYSAIASGRFEEAQRIIRQEKRRAYRMENEELVQACYAAKTYLHKTYDLNVEFLLKTSSSSTVVDNFYRQRIKKRK